VGAGVPWRGLLLAYGAGQLAANLPITPGGLGVVEGSLTIALVEYGGVEASTVAAVLLYRIISFWGFLPVGWAAWGGVTWANRRHDRSAVLAGLPKLPPHEGLQGGSP
jgi:putative heme transporter